MKENKMGVMPIDKLIISMSLPIMASMLVQALYNVVDSVFVSRIAEDALTAVSIAFPIQNLMIAVGVGTSVGVNALLARSLGSKDNEMIKKVASNAILLAVLSYALFLMVGLFFVGPFFRSQTDNETIISYGIDYMTIVCCLSFGLFAQVFFERILQSTGKTVLSMITQGIGAVVNIALDPILIFGLFGLPRLEVKGAALATVIGQMVGGTAAIILNLTRNKEIPFKLKGFRPDLKTIKEIYIIGLPSIIMQAIGSIMNYGMNKILISFTSTAAAVFGVYFKLQSFIFMPVFGLNNGIIPIVAYNYGAQKRDRVIKTIKHAVIYAMSIMVIGLIAFQVFPKQLLLMFDATDYMIELGVPALRIISLSFVFAGFCIALGSAFQALGYAVYSMVVSVARQLCVLLPAAYILAQVGGVNATWWSFPIAEIMSLAATVFFFMKLNKNVISKIGAKND